MRRDKLFRSIVLPFLAILLCLAAVAPSIGCAPLPDPSSDGVLRVVVTCFPAEEFARALLGEDLDGEAVMLERLGKAGQDLHAFEPSAADILSISSADLLICIGGYAETWLEDAIRASKNPSLRVLSLMDVSDLLEEEELPGIDHDHGHDHDHEHGGTEVEYDEHVWTSFHNAAHIAEAMETALCDLLPQAAEGIHSRAADYTSELESLHQAYAEVVASAETSVLVIADRYPFVYLMRELGLECYAAFPGCSSETQAGFSTQVMLTETVTEHGLPAVLYVDYGTASVAGAVSRATGAEVLRLWSGQVPSEEGLSYLDMLRENLDTLRRALGGASNTEK